MTKRPPHLVETVPGLSGFPPSEINGSRLWFYSWLFTCEIEKLAPLRLLWFHHSWNRCIERLDTPTEGSIHGWTTDYFFRISTSYHILYNEKHVIPHPVELLFHKIIYSLKDLQYQGSLIAIFSYPSTDYRKAKVGFWSVNELFFESSREFNKSPNDWNRLIKT